MNCWAQEETLNDFVRTAKCKGEEYRLWSQRVDSNPSFCHTNKWPPISEIQCPHLQIKTECSLIRGLVVVLNDRPYWKAHGVVTTAPGCSKGSNEWKLPLLLGMFMAVVVRNK